MINFTRFWSDLSFSEQHKRSIITVHTHTYQHTSNQDKLSSFFCSPGQRRVTTGEKTTWLKKKLNEENWIAVVAYSH